MATVLAQLNSGLGNQATQFDRNLERGSPIFEETWEGHQLEVRAFALDAGGRTLRFEGRAYPLGSPSAAATYNSTVVKELQNESLLLAKSPEQLGSLLGGLQIRKDEGGWQALRPAQAYRFDASGVPEAVNPALVNLFLREDISELPAWLLTQPAIDPQGHVFVQFHTVRSVLNGRNVIYRGDVNALLTEPSNEISPNWSLLPPIPPREPHDPVDTLLPRANVLGEMSVDNQGRVLVARHGLGGHSLWRFTPTGDPGPGELLVPGDWNPIYRPSEIKRYRQFPGEGQPPDEPIPPTSNPMVLNPRTDYEGNIYAIWGGEPGSLVNDLLRDLTPDQETGELEIRTVENINAIYRLPAEAEGGEAWEPLPPVPNMYYDESGQVVHDGNATRIGGITVSPSGEVYAMVVRDGADTMLKFAGGGWHLLPRADARTHDGSGGEEGDYADFNNFTVDSRGRLYGKDPNFEQGRIGIDTIYQYQGGHYQPEDPVTIPRLRYNLDPGPGGAQPVHRIVGGGVVTDREAYHFVPVASY